MDQQPDRTVEDALTRLRKVATDRPELREAALAYEIMIPILRHADLITAPAAFSSADVAAKMDKGLFLLQGIELDIDGKAYSDLVLKLAEALAALGSKNYSRAEAADEIAGALKNNAFDACILLKYVAGLDRDWVRALALNHNLDPDLLWTLGSTAIRPALRGLQRQLTPLANAAGWGKGYCFVCGATAALAELRGNNQSRHLRCGQCGADWPVRRLQCIYCGNDDHRSLGFLYAENHNDPARLEVCDSCSGYIKVISSFDPLPPDLLTVEDLITLHLDFIAMERGYSHGPASGPH